MAVSLQHVDQEMAAIRQVSEDTLTVQQQMLQRQELQDVLEETIYLAQQGG